MDHTISLPVATAPEAPPLPDIKPIPLVWCSVL